VNTVIFGDTTRCQWPSVLSLVRDKKYKETAFIGRAGDGPTNELYLIGSGCVSLARTPSMSWSGAASVQVDKFVDLDIYAKPKGT